MTRNDLESLGMTRMTRMTRYDMGPLGMTWDDKGLLGITRDG